MSGRRYLTDATSITSFVSDFTTRPSDDDDEKEPTVALPKTLNQKGTKKLLEQHGWRETRGGKHVVKMVKEGERPITLPRHRGQDYGPGLRRAILRQAGLV